MIIRVPYHGDKEKIDKIYNQFFEKNEYPDFSNRKIFLCPFVVTDDDDDKIIVAGGVKSIAEAVVVSDQNLPSRVRLNALLQALGSIVLIAKEMKHHQIHVFVNDDENYVGILQKFGFRLLDAKLLVLDIGEPRG